MSDLNNLNYSVISQEDNPEIKPIKHSSYVKGIMFDYDNLENPKGEVLRVTSVLTDSKENTYFRYKDILVYFEQEYYTEINNDILAKLLHNTVTEHFKDLGLLDTKKKIPNLSKIKEFIDSL